MRCHSLALIADAGHNLGDVLALALAWGAEVLATRPPSVQRTYGLRRASILAALANSILLLVAVGGIALEAIRRFMVPQPVAAGPVIAVAAAGVAINGATAMFFFRSRKSDINLRAAFSHMAADAGVSLGVVVAGVLIVLTGRAWLDPLASLLIALAIVWATWGLLHESLGLAMDAVPFGIDPTAVASYLRAVPGVTALHDLHIWAMSTTEAALTAHLVMPSAPADDARLREVAGALHAKFGIGHTTIQVECGDGPCGQAADEVL